MSVGWWTDKVMNHEICSRVLDWPRTEQDKDSNDYIIPFVTTFLVSTGTYTDPIHKYRFIDLRLDYTYTKTS